MIYCDTVYDLLAKGNIPNNQRGIRLEQNKLVGL